MSSLHLYILAVIFLRVFLSREKKEGDSWVRDTGLEAGWGGVGAQNIGRYPSLPLGPQGRAQHNSS
jgi:hypothetical protein